MDTSTYIGAVRAGLERIGAPTEADLVGDYPLRWVGLHGMRYGQVRPLVVTDGQDREVTEWSLDLPGVSTEQVLAIREILGW